MQCMGMGHYVLVQKKSTKTTLRLEEQKKDAKLHKRQLASKHDSEGTSKGTGVLQHPAVQCTPMCMHVTASSFLYQPSGPVRVIALSQSFSVAGENKIT
jgi:hypothetical protein